MNSTVATISCSPCCPRHGKCVDRIQSSSGIMTIRLIEMELGRFMGLAQTRSRRAAWLYYCIVRSATAPLLVTPITGNRGGMGIHSIPPRLHCSAQPSGVDAPLLDGIGHAVDGQHIGGNAVVYVVGLGVAHHIFEAVAEDGLQLLVDDGFLPEVALPVLHPFEVTGSNSAGVGQNVRDDGNQ